MFPRKFVSFQDSKMKSKISSHIMFPGLKFFSGPKYRRLFHFTIALINLNLLFKFEG